MREMIELGSTGGAIMFLPIPGISKIPFGAPKQIAQIIRNFMSFFVNHIDSHERDLDPENPRDFIDLYINRMTKTKVAITAL